MNDLPFSWQPCPPPAPGKFETIKIINKVTDSEGCTTFTIRRVVQTWDGQRWQVDDVSGWRMAQ